MKIETKYSVGDTVYSANAPWTGRRVPCTECGGTGMWTVVSSVREWKCPCSICCGPWDEITGWVEEYDFQPTVGIMTIGQVRAEQDDKKKVEYMCAETGIGSGQIWSEDRLFPTHEEAKAGAELLALQQKEARTKRDQAERDRKKDKRIRTPKP